MSLLEKIAVNSIIAVITPMAGYVTDADVGLPISLRPKLPFSFPPTGRSQFVAIGYGSDFDC